MEHEIITVKVDGRWGWLYNRLAVSIKTYETKKTAERMASQWLASIGDEATRLEAAAMGATKYPKRNQRRILKAMRKEGIEEVEA